MGQTVSTEPVSFKHSSVCVTPAEFTTNGEEQFWLRISDSEGPKVFTLIDENLNEKKRIDVNGACSFSYCDHSQFVYLDLFGLTQTLFNTDDKYEYITPALTTVHYDYGDYERMTGFNVVSEGDVKQTVYFPQGFSSDKVIVCNKIGTKLYLTVRVFDTNYNYYDLYYQIDRKSTRISMVKQNYIGKAQKIYSNGRIHIQTENGKTYTHDGIEVDRK